MKTKFSKPSWQMAAEYLLLLAVVVGLGHTAWFFYEYGYLPQPWFYEPSGTFMDWYSLSYFGHIRGAYDIEGSIYPPLSFVIMRIFSVAKCYPNARGEPSRDCDHLGMYLLSFWLLVNVIITFWTFYKIDRRTFFPRAFALSLGLPMLYTYERGNVLIFCYTCMILAFGPLIRSARLRWLFGGLAINFKVYLIGAAVAPLLRRRWLQTEGIIISAVAVYLVTWMILGEGDPRVVFGNISYYAGQFGAGRLLDLWYPSSFIPAISLLRGEYFPILNIMDSRLADRLLISCIILVRATQVLIVLAAIATWLRPEVVPRYRVIYFAIAMALTASEAGGYTEILLLLFVFMESWRGFARPLAIILAYLLCIPGEYVLYEVSPLVRWSWPAGSEVIVEYGIGLTSIIRPIVVLFLTWCLTSVTIKDVWTDIRSQGWSDRWRYRRDWPILPGVLRPLPKTGTSQVD